MATYFISDLHLQSIEPKILQIFLKFMRSTAREADALYILGDLFEAWIGDDDQNDLAKKVKDAIKQLSVAGVPCYFMRGNRDFAIGDRFAQESGIILLDDPTLITLYNRKVLLMHGDLLCIDDTKYQAFRRKVYDEKFRRRLLAFPLFMRRLIALWARYKSKRHTSQTNLTIQDVNQNEVLRVMQNYQVPMLIHGHTHRPAIHEFSNDDQKYTRIVLPAWHDVGHVLVVDRDWNIKQQVLNVNYG